MSYCQRFIVHGHVQGVGFRASTQQQARGLGLTGWVRNDPEGFVEVLACGTQAQLQPLRDWLEHGPGPARVSQVEASPSQPTEEAYETFEVR